MKQLRREPFRVFFPLGLVLALAGVLPWALWATGRLAGWPGLYHSLTMTQSFLVAVAVGFLGTMLPRRTKADPLSTLEIAVVLLALLGVPLTSHFGSLPAAELCFAVVLMTLGQYVLRAALSRHAQGAVRPPPSSFVWLPVSVLLGLLGAGLLAGSSGLPDWAAVLGRQLAQQGLMLGLVLGIGPMLTPLLATGEAPADPTPQVARRQRALHLLRAAAFLGSFFLEAGGAPRAGVLLRGAVCAAVLLPSLRRPWQRRGLHRQLARLAFWLVPVGLLLAGALPLGRVAFLHVTFIGGLALLCLAISIHVGLLHTGREHLAEGRPVLVGLAGGLMLAAAAARTFADFAAARYPAALALAALCWLASCLLWGAFMVPKLLVGSEQAPG